MAPEAPADAFCDNVGGLCEGYSKRAYVTFLAGDADYVKGVVELVKGLRKVKSAYPLIVAGLPDVPDQHRRLLSSRGCIVHEIQPIYPPENHIQFAMAYYVINYSKLRIWEGSKPWSCTRKEENMQREDIKMLVNKWLEIYNDLNLDFKWTYVVANAQITISGLQQVTENSLLAALPRMYPAFTSVPPAA